MDTRPEAADPYPGEDYGLGLVVDFSSWVACFADGVVVAALSNSEDAQIRVDVVNALAAAVRYR